jgi:hypothetical protein
VVPSLVERFNQVATWLVAVFYVQKGAAGTPVNVIVNFKSQAA